MTTVKAILDARAPGSARRTATRRKLHLPTQGVVRLGAADVLILNMSRTGLLLETAGLLAEGETIELDIPEAVRVRAIVKWSSGDLFGCQFIRPISSATVSAALLRAPYALPEPKALVPAPAVRPLANRAPVENVPEGELSLAARMRWIIGLAILSWVLRSPQEHSSGGSSTP